MGLLQLHDFLSNGGDLDDIEVLVSRSLVECGYGRFMIEVSVSIPFCESIDEEDSDVNTTLLFRKLFLFSSRLTAIIWMSDSCPSSRPFCPINEDMTLAAVKMEEGGRYGSKVVSLSSSSPAIMSLSVDPSGNFNTSTLIQGSDSVRKQIIVDRWSLRQAQKRPVVMLDNQVVVADNMIWDRNGAKKCVISFYPIPGNDDLPMFNTLDLIGNLEVCHLTSLRADHIIAICRLFDSTSDEADVDVDVDVDELVGHWFGPGGSNCKVYSYVIVIDVETRTEIFRTCLVDDLRKHLGTNSTGLSASNGELPI